MIDLNARISFLLYDLAEIQKSKQSEWGYRRAAHSVLLLEEQLTKLVEAGGALPKIPNVGPKSLQVIREVLESGSSPTVEAAIRESGKVDEITTRRLLRVNFLSRAMVLAALADERLGGVSRTDYQGDFQMHSDWSDGTLSLAEMAKACVARGYRYSAVTDHSDGLRVVRGLSPADMARQREEIATINRDLDGRFRLLAGIEANIGLDGSIDVPEEQRLATDLVVAAPHSGLRLTTDQTERMVAAVQIRGVHVLGHPRGRQRGNRAGIAADWDQVFAAAAKSRVAIEIDGDPARQDVDFELAGRAHKAGCLFALDSDAHSALDLGFADIAIAHARLGGIPADRVINCWPLEQLLAWVEERRAA